ncbi:MAG TPA: ABC transporter substrate-binding protein [Actinomycetes bacterium]|nr:ABC transporter substrate-binding protein [Actinomycetes bacterium]
MKRIRVLSAIAVAAALALTGCGGDGGNPLTTGAATGPATAGTTAGSTGTAAGAAIVVGSANFPENELLAQIYAKALAATGASVSTKLNIGSRETYIPALQDGSIDLLPEYSGVLLQYFDKSATAVTPDDVYTALGSALPSGLIVLDRSQAEDKDAVVVTRETAEKYSLKSIADLAPVAKDLVLGGPPEWKTRPTGVPGLAKVYGLTFKEFKPLDVAGPLSVQALKNGQVQAVNLFTTQSAIKANDFVVLDDPKNLFAAQNVVPLIRESKATDAVRTTPNAISAALTTDELAALVKQVEVDKADAAEVAETWLQSKDLL